MDVVQCFGRTGTTKEGYFSCNWTCSGLRFGFQGSSLVVRVLAVAGIETDPALGLVSGMNERRETWPYLAVFLDDEEEPYQIFKAGKADHIYLLFQTEKEEYHTISVRKLTENCKGKVFFVEFLTDGEILRAEKVSYNLKMEFIGDSITCGFGNMINDRDRGFYPEDENGWMSHAAIAARKLNADFSVISYSGMAVSPGTGKNDFPPFPLADYYYPYLDRVTEELDGVCDDPTPWDFQKYRPDVIVINLGTNDAAVIDLNGDTNEGIVRFEADYYNFLKSVRKYNGSKPWIICALGSMDYFLYENIKRAAAMYCQDAEDARICCFKYGRMRINDGVGAANHPFVTTQIRMGWELADFIKKNNCF